MRLTRYRLVLRQPATGEPDPDFLAGLEPLRLLPLFDTLLTDGAVRRSFVDRARRYMTFMESARRTVGLSRVENASAGYKALLALIDQVGSAPRLAALVDLRPCLDRLALRR